MKIRTRLCLLSATFLILIMIVGLTALFSFRRLNTEFSKGSAVNSIIKDVCELDIVTYEYIIHHEERMRQQWRLKYNSLGKLLKSVKRGEMHPEHLPILDCLITDHKALSSLFTLLEDNLAEKEKLIKEDRPQSEIDVTLSLGERLIAQSLINSQEITVHAFELSALIEEAIARTEARANLLILSSIIGFVIVSSYISFLTIRAVTRPISELIRGAEIIGTGDLEHRVKIESKDEIGVLANAFNQMVGDLNRESSERKQAESRVQHLNIVLRAIRNVNQLIAKEKDRERLLKGACRTLVETRGYRNAWIALLDESGKLVTTAESGLGKDFLPMIERLKRGDLSNCGAKAMSQPGVVVTQDPVSACTECPLANKYAGAGAMTSALQHGGKSYGFMCLSVPRQFSTDEDEQALFKEVAVDIAFALHSIELESERKRLEEALKEYSEGLEETVQKRTKELQDYQERLIRQE